MNSDSGQANGCTSTWRNMTEYDFYPKASSSQRFDIPDSLVDPIWEVIDPTPDIYALFMQYNDAYFDGKLSGCELKWSNRMTLCAGVCSYEGKGGLCSIRLSEPLLKFRPRKDLVETLLHEMIHGYLFVTDGFDNHEEHGPKFLYHMKRLNVTTGTNITVRHNFHDEVKFHQQHWWRCTGICRTRAPYYGYVKRSMNRAPSKNDYWWENHRKKCKGVFVKVKEPEDYGMKKKKNGKEMGKDGKIRKPKTSLDHFFPGVGHVLGGHSLSSPSDNASSFSCQKKEPEIEGDIERIKPEVQESAEVCNTEDNRKMRRKVPEGRKDAAVAAPSTSSRENDSEMSVKAKILGNDKESAALSLVKSIDDEIVICVSCPVCHIDTPENTINSHLDVCLLQNS